jgi:hypothetical protein
LVPALLEQARVVSACVGLSEGGAKKTLEYGCIFGPNEKHGGQVVREGAHG